MPPSCKSNPPQRDNVHGSLEAGVTRLLKQVRIRSVRNREVGTIFETLRTTTAHWARTRWPGIAAVAAVAATLAACSSAGGPTGGGLASSGVSSNGSKLIL